MSIADSLCREYERVLKLRWPGSLSGEERMWMVVYDPPQERKIRARLVQFELTTKEAGRKWRLVRLEGVFPEWLATNKYREQLFANPKALAGALDGFKRRLTEFVQGELAAADDQTVVALTGAGSLFGLWSVSELLGAVAGEVNGIVLVFFPGRHEGTSYRLMDARASWNYLALAIEPKVGE
ncbi:MAG: DUF1788 domain-containing protein [Dehalococcoidia bacterium]|nr:DUF1788 domain-containing protein [Dehalococcoidia bacterium]